jgi:hypothetical protein
MGRKIPCFQNHCPCYAARHSLFFGLGNFAEIADDTPSASALFASVRGRSG